MSRPLRYFSVCLLVGLVLAAGLVRLPYYAVGPGPGREITPLITIDGHPRYESTGSLVMTTIRWYPATAIQALWAYLDPEQQLVSRGDLFGTSLTTEQEARLATTEMEQSKIDATYVVLADLAGYPRERGVGALVEWVGIDCPAASEIDIGDTIVAVEGASISSSRAASRAIDAVPANDRVELRVVDRSGETSEISLMRRRCAGQSRPILGISTIDAFPIDVEIASGEIGGPSAGLMWALGLRDLLTPDDLTGGRLIAGTGTIRTDGSVGPIGGVKDKVSAAKRIGADVLLIPADNAAELKGIDAEGLQIVPVATYDEAVAFLEAL